MKSARFYPNNRIKNLSINENGKLEFGIGIVQNAWDKPGDGVMFKIIVIDGNSQNHVILSQLIEPKNNVEERKWFGNIVSLNAYAVQMVSLIFKTSGGPKAILDTIGRFGARL